MKATQANFLTFIKRPIQFVIPIYQRTYSWHKTQCEKLLNDILRISRDDSVPGHFIGSIVYFQESIHTVSDVPQRLVIDGQQRLTTITLLIAAISEFIKNNDVEIDTNFRKLRNYYLINAEEDNDLRYKLLLTRKDKRTLINLLDGIENDEKSSQRITENFDYFKDRITEDNVASIYNGVQRLFIVDVALEKDKDNPQLIFESLNSTGLDLSQADLIRNFILMGQDSATQTELYEKYWYPMERSYGSEYTKRFDWYMRDYLTVKMGKIPRIGGVYEEFKNYIHGGVRDIKEVIADIYKFSNYYVKMVLHREESKNLLEAFKNISRLRVDVSYPFLLPVYDDYANGILSEEEFIEIVTLVENYVFRRAVCGIPTNSLNKTFAILYKSVHKDNYVESLKADFQKMDGYKRFPNDQEFELEIVIKDLYNFRSRNYLLDKLENYKRKERVVITDYTIEHIMPQNPKLSNEWKKMLGDNWKTIQEKYLHTLGNLTLTGYNSELSDHPFEKKKTIEGGFNDSPIKLNDYLRKTDVWNVEEISNRALELAEKANKVWWAPNLSNEVLEKYDTSEKKEQAVYTIEDFPYLTGDLFELFETLRKRILNLDSSVKEEYKKLYIAYKTTTNFVDIVPQKARLRLSLNIAFDEIVDPFGICKDITDLGRWGNGDVEVGIDNFSDMDKTMDLIEQAFNSQAENI